MIEQLVLGILTGEDMAGYAIKKAIEKSFSLFCRISFGSLHPALKRLEEKGCVTTSEIMRGERKSITYHITEKGSAYFYEWLTTPMTVMDGTNENLAKICFFDIIPAEARGKMLKSYTDNNREYLAGLMKLRGELENLGCFKDYYYKLSTLYYGICITEKTIEWCEHIRSGKPLHELLKGEKL